MKDPFSYKARWDGIGLDCSHCWSFRGPAQWPDKGRTSRCEKHNLSLAIELDEAGHKEGEWFCRDFDDSGSTDKNALKEFGRVQASLKNKTLYGGYGENGELKEIPFEEMAQ